MGAAAAFSTPQSVGLGDRVTFLRGYLSAVNEVDLAPPDEIVAKKFHELAQACTKACPRIKERNNEYAAKGPDDPSLKAYFVFVDGLIGNFRLLFNFVEQHTTITDAIGEKDWLAVWQIIEVLEEARETLALGLSPEFRRQTAEARQEAGLDDLSA